MYTLLCWTLSLVLGTFQLYDVSEAGYATDFRLSWGKKPYRRTQVNRDGYYAVVTC
jgi:hypothetical protein